ncbi:MAG: VanW family protein [Polyangiaceae bacterium]
MNLRRVLALSFVGLSLTSAGLAGELARRTYERTVPAPDRAARGVRVQGVDVPPDRDVRAFVEELAASYLDRKIDVRYDGATLFTATGRELGATADVDWVVAEVMKLGHTGDAYDKYMESKRAAAGEFDVHLPIQIDARAFSERFAARKEELDESPSAARKHLETGEVEPHEDGRYLDAFAATERALTAIYAGEAEIDAAPYLVHPRATAEAIEKADLSVVLGSFETRFGGPPGRDQNIARATSLLDGILLMPGDEVSYNEEVGPRSIQNGFALAPEIYKGEIRAGVGGGACQVASTLHAAALFGGLEVVERRNHSRPSGYIRAGLDATVSFPVLDLRIKNPFEFPVLLHAKLEKGLLRFEILGHDKPVDVDLATATASVFKYTRKVERSSFLPDGETRVKQRGKNGMSVKRVKTSKKRSDGSVTVEESLDIYPPTQEIVIVNPKFDVKTLPPLPGAEGAVPSG